ncbi:MAG: hypothetical protein ABI668_13685 [Sphingorhabdus sp.]
MHFITVLFNFTLLMCAIYASIFGGRTGRGGSIIFIAATILTIVAFNANPTWNDTSYGVFAVDLGCLAALVFLATRSTRYWPIWAVGFQTVAVATHLATIFAEDTVPNAYRALLSFWGIPILVVMVAGTCRDHQYELAIQRSLKREIVP